MPESLAVRIDALSSPGGRTPELAFLTSAQSQLADWLKEDRLTSDRSELLEFSKTLVVGAKLTRESSAASEWKEETGTAAVRDASAAATADPCCPRVSQQKRRAAPKSSALFRRGGLLAGWSTPNCLPEEATYALGMAGEANEAANGGWGEVPYLLLSTGALY